MIILTITIGGILLLKIKPLIESTGTFLPLLTHILRTILPSHCPPRIGQTQTVVVKRLIMKSSIEEQILQLQQKKMELAQTAIDNKNPTGEPIGILPSPFWFPPPFLFVFPLTSTLHHRGFQIEVSRSATSFWW